jgi:peptidoglycan/LPS O-acetylase OafA/YrhL
MYRVNHNHKKLFLDPVKKETNLDYLAGIDGLRAIAVLAVLIYHIDFFSFLPGGYTGVDVFFVISGYVISK